MPARLAHYFPAVRGIETSLATGACVLRLERIRAPTGSHLLVSRCITPARLDLVLRALHDIHSEPAPAPASGPEPSLGPALGPGPAQPNIYANYLPKIRARYQKHAQLYQEVAGGEVDSVYRAIADALNAYESGRQGHPVAVVHGDPVLSNVLLSRDARVHFIDMRGALDCHPTLGGDAAYDFAKVLQSLCGYDYILHNVPVGEQDRALLGNLRSVLYARVQEWLGPTFTPRRLLIHAA